MHNVGWVDLETLSNRVVWADSNAIEIVKCKINAKTYFAFDTKSYDMYSFFSLYENCE